MDMANWQNYRSQVNGMPAVFTANIEDLDVYHGKHLSKVVQFTVPYLGDEDGLPNEDEYEKLINRLFKILAQLTALPNCILCRAFYLQPSGKNAISIVNTMLCLKKPFSNSILSQKSMCRMILIGILIRFLIGFTIGNEIKCDRKRF